MEICSESLEDQELKLSGSVMKQINRSKQNMINFRDAEILRIIAAE